MGHHKLTILCVAALAYLTSAEVQTGLKCGKGLYVYEGRNGHSCKECLKGTYMPFEKHSYRTCITCQKADRFQHEVEAAPCTATTNTVIKCTPKFYRDEMKDRTFYNGMCRRCSKCKYNQDGPFEAKKCSDFHNTVCCPRPTDIAVKGKDGKFICSGNDIPMDVPQRVPPQQHPLPASKREVYRLIGCHPGEYMTFYNSGNQLARCRQCPLGTFMDREKHMEAYCKQCSAEEGKILLKKCTPTADAIFGNVLVVYQDKQKKFDRVENEKDISSRAQILRDPSVIVCLFAALTIVKKSRFRWRRWLM